MNVIIGGCGRVGSRLALRLAAEGHQVAVIDKNPEALRALGRQFQGPCIRGMVFDREALAQAGAADCDAFIAVTSGDNSNVVGATIAKEMFGVTRVIARIFDPRRADIYRRLGIPTVSSVAWAANEIASLVAHPILARDVILGNGEVSLVRMAVSAEKAGSPVSGVGVSGKVRVVAVVRDGEAFLPGPDEKLAVNDIVEVAVHSSALHLLSGVTTDAGPMDFEPANVPADDRRQAAVSADRADGRSILIVGGGKVGAELATMLGSTGMGISVIEKDEARCDSIEPGLNELGVAVYHGDGNEPSMLEDAGIADADVVVAATGDDEDNLVVCLLARHEYEVGLTLARVNNPKNAWLFTEAFGVDIPISQTTMIAELLSRQVPGQS